MAVTVTRLMDFIASHARENGIPTLVVRTSNEGSSSRIADELGMLPDDALDALRADEIAIIEFKYDSELEAVFERVQLKPYAEESCLSVHAHAIYTTGRPANWNTPRW